MNRLIACLLLIPAISSATPFDLLIQQRNIADTATLTRTVPLPSQGIYSIVGIDSFTNFPSIFKLSPALGIINGELSVSQTWADILNKPAFSTVATSGDYNDLSNKPTFSQINADWLASSGTSQILNKPSLSAVATSGSYSDLSGSPSIPAAQINSDWDSSSGISQILNKPTTLIGYGISDAYPLSGNPSAFITQAGARSAITLTTTGTSGTATYNNSTGMLNIPNYAPGTGTVTSVTAGVGLSGGIITTSGTVSMPNTGTPGTYSGVTTDAQGRVTSGTSRSINNTPGRSLVSTTTSTGFQISASRDSMACYEGSFSTTSTIGGPSAASVFLDTADTNSTTAGDWTTIGKQTYSNTITLAVVLNQVQGNNWSICRYIPAGKFVRIRSGSVSGTASVSLNTEQQEVLQ